MIFTNCERTQIVIIVQTNGSCNTLKMTTISNTKNNKKNKKKQNNARFVVENIAYPPNELSLSQGIFPVMHSV